MLSVELMRGRIADLEQANEAATKRRQRKKKRLQRQGVLTKEQGVDILARQEAKRQAEQERRQASALAGVNRQALARCKQCREPGHNPRTCRKDTLDTA
jgi:hypothetical protein